MLELLSVIICCWLFLKVVKLAFRAAWGVAKIAASVLLALAVPMLVCGVIFAGGVLLLIPVALIALAFGLLKACVA